MRSPSKHASLIFPMKPFPCPVLYGCCIAILALSLAPAARAQTTTIPYEAPAATPRYTPVPKPKPTPAPDVPVGTVNGQPIYRPLLGSELSNPVDRALVVYDYNRSRPRLSDSDIDEAVQDFKRAKFNNSDAKLDAKLASANATRADFRQYVAEEVKIHVMLGAVTRSAVSIHGAQRAQAAYLARLHQTALVNKPRT